MLLGFTLVMVKIHWMPIGSQPERNVGLWIFFDREQHLISPTSLLRLGGAFWATSDWAASSWLAPILGNLSITHKGLLDDRLSNQSCFHGMMMTCRKHRSTLFITSAHLSFPCSPSEPLSSCRCFDPDPRIPNRQHCSTQRFKAGQTNGNTYRLLSPLSSLRSQFAGKTIEHILLD